MFIYGLIFESLDDFLRIIRINGLEKWIKCKLPSLKKSNRNLQTIFKHEKNNQNDILIYKLIKMNNNFFYFELKKVTNYYCVTQIVDKMTSIKLHMAKTYTSSY